jgi:hypothetical protein
MSVYENPQPYAPRVRITPDSTGRAPNPKPYILGWRINIHGLQNEFLIFMVP